MQILDFHCHVYPHAIAEKASDAVARFYHVHRGVEIPDQTAALDDLSLIHIYKRPILSDLRESGAIEQDADEVLFLYRDDYYNENSEEKNVAECIVSKNRHGETGTVKLQWLPQYTTFTDREWKHAE